VDSCPVRVYGVVPADSVRWHWLCKHPGKRNTWVVRTDPYMEFEFSLVEDQKTWPKEGEPPEDIWTAPFRPQQAAKLIVQPLQQ
jgi:hypothetical protein